MGCNIFFISGLERDNGSEKEKEKESVLVFMQGKALKTFQAYRKKGLSLLKKSTAQIVS